MSKSESFWKYLKLFLYLIVVFIIVYISYTMFYVGPYLTTLIIVFALFPSLFIMYKSLKMPTKSTFIERLNKLTLIEKMSFILGIGIVLLNLWVLFFYKNFEYTFYLFLISLTFLFRPLRKLYKVRYSKKMLLCKLRMKGKKKP